MKVIRNFLFVLMVYLSFFGCTNPENNEKNYDFVRFGLLVNTNGRILEFPEVKDNIVETSNYIHLSTKTIKIPIVLTSKLKDVPVDVYFEVSTEGDFTDFNVSSVNKISIPAGKLVDTLKISFNSRWSNADINKIKLKITGVSNPNISIGWNNSERKMDQLTIILGDLSKTRYAFEKNLYNVSGALNEELLIPIQFSQPITNAMIGNFNFIQAQFVALSACDGSGGNFNYSLTQMPFLDGATKIFYKLKVLENTAFASNLLLSLNSGLTDFIQFGINQTNIQKPNLDNRQGNPAGNWYNVSDNFYRTYGKAWYFNSTDGVCKWSNFFAFTKPVLVPAGSQFDNGQGYHKYQVGFVGNSAPIGTNPFDMQRFYDGAKVVSPAFTVIKAIEFFPTNGNSTTTGIVKVIPQTLIFVRSADDAVINIPICGSGNYYYNPTFSRWEMYLEVHCDDTAVGGSSNVVRAMYIYSNNNNSGNPTNLNNACSTRVNL